MMLSILGYDTASIEGYQCLTGTFCLPHQIIWQEWFNRGAHGGSGQSDPTSGTELHLNNMNREDGFSLRRSWKPLLHTLREQKKTLFMDKIVISDTLCTVPKRSY
jgi:hypothetical protein